MLGKFCSSSSLPGIIKIPEHLPWWCAFFGCVVLLCPPSPPFPHKQQMPLLGMSMGSLYKSWLYNLVVFSLVWAAVTLEEASGFFLKCILLMCYLKVSGLSFLGICYLPPASVLAPASLGWVPYPQEWGTFLFLEGRVVAQPEQLSQPPPRCDFPKPVICDFSYPLLFYILYNFKSICLF